MIEDMTIRKFAPKTQHDYMQRVNNFAAFLGRSPDTAGFEDARRYRLHLAANDVGLRIQLGRVPTLSWICSSPLSITLLQQFAHAEYRGSDIARKLSSSAILAYDASAATNWCGHPH
jgi:integrase/recombinase XerD